MFWVQWLSGFFYNNNGIFDSVIFPHYDFLSMGALFHSTNNSFQIVLCIMSLNGLRDPLILRLNYRCWVLERVNPFDTFSVELMGFLVARDIFQNQNNFKMQSLTGKVLLDMRDRASVEPVQKCSPCPSLLVVRCTTEGLVAGAYLFPLSLRR